MASSGPASPLNASGTVPSGIPGLPSRHVEGPFGIGWDTTDPYTLVSYSVLNVLIHSVMPLPITSVFWVGAVVLYGPLYGFLVAVLTSTIGCYIGFLIARCARPFFLRVLGEHSDVWRSVERALARDGWKIPLLLRSTPVMPVVLTNFLLALTSVDDFTYVWTVTVGMIPSGLPYAYAAVVGEKVLHEWPPTDGVMLTVSAIGLVATVLVVWKIGAIAADALERAGVSPRTPPAQRTWGDETMRDTHLGQPSGQTDAAKPPPLL